MKYNVEKPTQLVDITRLPGLDTIEETTSRRPADRRAGHQQRRWPTTIGSTAAIRCWPAPSWPARRRSCATPPRPAATCCSARAATTSTTPRPPATNASPGSGCAAIGGHQPHPRHPGHQRALHRHPSVRHVRGARGAGGHGACHRPERRPRPSRSPTSIACPATIPSATPRWRTTKSSPRSSCRPKIFRAHYTYLKLRDRLSYAFALVSVAAALELDGGRSRRRASRLGGVAHKPWRDPAGRGFAPGQPATADSFARAAEPAAGRREGLRPQRLQDRACPPGDRSRAGAGRCRHAAVADRQAHR